RPNAEVRVELAALRQVTDGVVAPADLAPEHTCSAFAQRDDAKHRLQKRRLACPVRAEDGHELARLDGEGGIPPDGAAGDADRGVVELDRGRVMHVACTNHMRMSLAVSWSRAAAKPDRRRSPLALRDPGTPRLVDRRAAGGSP